MTVDLIERVVGPRSVKEEEVLRKNVADKKESETRRTIASRVPELSSRMRKSRDIISSSSHTYCTNETKLGYHVNLQFKTRKERKEGERKE